MPRVVLTQEDFSAGELSLALLNRIKAQVYYNGVERMSNFIPTKEGNAKYRNGFPYVAGVKSDNLAFFINFVSLSTNRYLLEFTEDFCRVYEDNVLLQTLASPYKEADLFNIKFDVEGDILYLVDNNHVDYKLTKTSSTTFTLARVDYDSAIPPYRPQNTSAITLTASAVSGAITITASAALFRANDVGRYVRFESGTVGFARITGFTSATVVSATTIVNLPAVGPLTTWTLSVIANAIAFYESRRVLGKENFLNFSRTPDDVGIDRYEDFTLGTDDDHALFISSARFGGELRWLVGTDRMLSAGSYKGTFRIDSGSLQEPITISQPPVIHKIGGEGVANIAPIERGNKVFFVEKDGISVNVIDYSFENDGFITQDLNEFSTDIPIEGMTQLAFKRGKNKFLFAVKNNGELLGMVWRPRQKLRASWFRINTEGIIESIAVVPTSENKDRLYLSIQRTIDGNTKRYIEYLSDDVILSRMLDFFTGEGNKDADTESYLLDLYEKQKDFNFLDSSISYDGSDQSVSMTPSAVTGLDITFTAGGALFAAGDVGREIWEKDGTGRAKIITFTSTTVVKCNILSDFASINAISAGDWYFTTNNITDLSHLEGETVNAIRDGGRDPDDYVVASGEITLTSQGSKVTVGLIYKGIIKTFNLEGGSANGSSRIKPKIVNKLGITFLDSISSKYGTDIYDLSQIESGPSPVLGRSIPVFTGLKRILIADTSEEDKNIYIVQDDPLPCIVQSVIPIIEANEP